MEEHYSQIDGRSPSAVQALRLPRWNQLVVLPLRILEAITTSTEDDDEYML